MIGKLTGTAEVFEEDQIILEVNNVGYLVRCPARIIENLTRQPDPVTLLIETFVREDQITLYGFENHTEKHFFQLLCKINGIGAKTALNILSGLSPDQIQQAVIANQPAVLKKIPGVGSKAAARIIIDLGTSISKLRLQAPSSEAGNADNEKFNDSLSALVNLGFDPLIAGPLINNLIKNNPEISAEQLIKSSLQKLGNNWQGA